TDAPVAAAALRVAASGAAALADPKWARGYSVALPARATTPVVVYVRGASVGTGVIDASIAAPGLGPLAAHHEWQVKPAGEALTVVEAVWVERAATAALTAASAEAGATPTGPARLVLERGLAPVLAAALESLRPERLIGPRAIADALEVFGRVRAWAITRGGETDPLAVRARELAGRAAGRKEAHFKDGHGGD